MLTILSTLRTLFSISSVGTFCSLRPNAMFSYTSRCGKSAYLWKTVLTGRSCGGVSVMFTPLMCTSPESAEPNPARILSKVVFPQPDGPRMVMNSPCLTLRLTSLRMHLSPKHFDIFLNSIMFSLFFIFFFVVKGDCYLALRPAVRSKFQRKPAYR